VPWKLLILAVLGLPLLVKSYRARFGWQLATPLLLVEGLWHAHLDILGVALGSGLMLAMERRRPALAGILLAAMVGIKLLPLLLLPACLLHLGRRERWRFLIGMALTLVLVFAPYVAEGFHLFASFRAFAGQWAFNNPLFLGLKAALGAGVARGVMALGLLLAMAWILRQRRPLAWHCTALWLSLSLFSPTVFPWYLLWLLAFVPRERARWLVLIYAASFLSYMVLIDFRSHGVWRESAYWLAPEWVVLVYAGRRLLDFPRENLESPNSDL
jgi:alpha-1,6-mannosyltransferase